MAGRRRLPIVIAHQRRHNSAVSALETRNTSTARKILAVLVVPAMADHLWGIVMQRAGLEQQARFRWQMMNRLQLIEEQNAELPHVLGVTLIVFHAAREAARADEELTRGCIVAMRLLAREGVARDFLEQPFTNADAGNRE